MSRALHANFSSYDLVSGGWSEVRSQGDASRGTRSSEETRRNTECLPSTAFPSAELFTKDLRIIREKRNHDLAIK